MHLHVPWALVLSELRLLEQAACPVSTAAVGAINRNTPSPGPSFLVIHIPVLALQRVEPNTHLIKWLEI